MLVEILHEEAFFLNIQMRLVSDRKLKKSQKKRAKKNQSKIFELWSLYKHGGMSVDRLLEQLSRVYGK